MPTNFPVALDNLPSPTAGQNLNDPGVEHAAVHTNANDAIEALQAKVGINGSSVPTSLDYKSFAQAYSNAGTPIPASTWTKVVLSVLEVDRQGEFANSRFTAKAAGLYLVLGAWAEATAAADGKRMLARIAADGNVGVRGFFDFIMGGASVGGAVPAGLLISLSAGQFLELYAWSSVAGNTTADSNTWMSVVKVA